MDTSFTAPHMQLIVGNKRRAERLTRRTSPSFSIMDREISFSIADLIATGVDSVYDGRLPKLLVVAVLALRNSQ